MPRYVYTCEKCGRTFDGFSMIAQRNEPQDCECGGKAKRDVEAELNSCGDFNATMQDHPRWSDAMGCSPHEIEERKKMFPGSVYDPSGRLLIRNRKHKQYEMKRRQMYD